MSNTYERLETLLAEAERLSKAGQHQAALEQLKASLKVIMEAEINLAAAGEGSTVSIAAPDGLQETDLSRAITTTKSRITHAAIAESIDAGDGIAGLDLLARLKGRRLVMYTERLQTKREVGDVADLILPMTHHWADDLLAGETSVGGALCVVEFYLRDDETLWVLFGRAESGELSKSEWLRIGHADDTRPLRIVALKLARAATTRDRASAIDEMFPETRALMTPIIDYVAREQPDKVVLIPHRFLHLLPLHALPDSEGRTLADIVPIVTYASNSLQYDWCKHIAWQCEAARFRYAIACIDATGTVSGLAMAAAFPALVGMREPLIVLNPRTEQLMLAVKGASTFLYFGHATSDFQNFADAHLATYDRPTRFSDLVSDDDGSEISVAMLTGCETGVNANIDDIQDEYYGLDGALCARGTATVISTLWQVSDLAGFLISWFVQRAFPDVNEPAIVLRDAVQWLRSGAWYAERQDILQRCDFDGLIERAPSDQIKDLLKEAQRRFIESFSRLSAGSFFHPVHWAAWRYLGWGAGAATRGRARLAPDEIVPPS